MSKGGMSRGGEGEATGEILDMLEAVDSEQRTHSTLQEQVR